MTEFAEPDDTDARVGGTIITVSSRTPRDEKGRINLKIRLGTFHQLLEARAYFSAMERRRVSLADSLENLLTIYYVARMRGDLNEVPKEQ